MKVPGPYLGALGVKGPLQDCLNYMRYRVSVQFPIGRLSMVPY